MSHRVPLGEIAEINPRLPEILSSTDSDRLVPFLPMSAVSENGFASYTKRRPLRELLKGYTQFARGDILVAKITPCLENGKAAHLTDLPETIGFGSTEFHVLRPGPDIDGRYLFHAVWSPRFRDAAERNMTGTAGQKRVPASFLETFRIPLPPLPEQRRIAAVLDKADAIRRKRRESLHLLDEFLPSAILEILEDASSNEKGWEVVNVEDLAAKTPNAFGIGPFGSDLKVSDYVKDGHPVVFVRDIGTGRFHRSSKVCVSDAKFLELASHHVRPGDVVVTKMGSPPGLSAVYPETMPVGVITADILRIRCNRTLCTPEYVAAIINSPICQRQVAKITEGVTRPKVTLRDFRLLRIPLPPLSLQRRYTESCAAVDALRERQWNALDETHQLFESLEQRAFRGEGLA